MTLKEHKAAKMLMTKIINAAKIIRRDVHEFHIHDETFAQMNCLTIFVEKAKVLMDTLKPRQPDDDQPVLLDLDEEAVTIGRVSITPNGTEPGKEDKEAELSA